VKIGFIFNTPFHILSVVEQAVSDATTAVSFLAIELAKLGHDVTVFSDNDGPAKTLGVRCCNISIRDRTLNLDSTILEPDFEVLIFKNDSPEFIISVKNSLPYKPKIYLWTSFDYNQTANNGLYSADIVTELDGIICVSEWQRKRLRSKLQINGEKLWVQRYAISPVYENLFANAKNFIATSSKVPSIAYTATQLDGLDLLLDLLDDVTNNYARATLSIYADLSSSPDLTAQCKTHKAINIVANLTGKQLAEHLKIHTILACPGLEEQTSNIALTEAMAAGLYVVTSRSGAISEYCYGHGKQIAEDELCSDSLSSFVGQLLSICQTQMHSSDAFYDYCYKQILEINKKHTYRARAREWVDMLSTLIKVDI